MRITDAQIHLWDGDDAPPHHWRAPYTIDRAPHDMDEAGVDRAVNCPAIWDPGANDYAVEAAKSHPERFATLGWFPLDEAADESLVDASLDKPGMLGLRFMLAAAGMGDRLASGGLDWLWAAADRRGIAMGLMVMPPRLPAVDDIAARSYGLPGQTELQGAVREALQVQVPFGVQLDKGRRTLELTLPGGAVGVHPGYVTRQAGVAQRPLEAVAGDVDGQDGFLP